MNMKKPIKILDSPRESFRFSLDLEVGRPKASMQGTNKISQEFNFDVPSSAPIDVSIADRLIRNGSLIPLNIIQQQNNEEEKYASLRSPVLTHSRSVDASKMHRTLSHHVYQDHPISSNSARSPVKRSLSSIENKVLRDSKRKVSSSEGSQKSSKKIISKCFKSLVHFCKKVKGFRLEVRRVSPRMNDDSTKSGCSSPLHDAVREKAISEAITYCKSSSRKHLESS